MADGGGGQVAIDDLEACVVALFGGDDLGRQLAADGAGTENAGIDVQEFRVSLGLYGVHVRCPGWAAGIGARAVDMPRR